MGPCIICHGRVEKGEGVCTRCFESVVGHPVYGFIVKEKDKVDGIKKVDTEQLFLHTSYLTHSVAGFGFVGSRSQGIVR